MSLGVDTETQIISLMNQARIFVLEGQWDKSSATFQKAIKMAEQAHNYMQQAETLIEFARVLAGIDDGTSSQAYEDAEKICLQYGYNELLSRAKEYRGDSKFQLHEYQSAFQYYGEACRAITDHNILQYQKILRKVIDNLLEIPYQEINPIVDALIAYWVEQGLAVKYPELINSCKEVKALIK
jgi:tetratricopeptide (TPR) repeat protein